MKITSTKKSKHTRPTKNGWHTLTTDELTLWAYMWLERTENSRFSQPVRPWAIRLHTTSSTADRQLKKLTTAGVIYPDGKNGQKASDGWKVTAVYFVQEPPAEVLGLAYALWAVNAVRGKASPVPQMGHAEGCVNSGDARVPEVEHLTTLCNQCKPLSESPSVISYGTLSIDSVGVPKAGHGEGCVNIDDSRVPDLDHGPEAELSRVRAEMNTYTTSEPPEELFTRRRALEKEVKRLKALSDGRAS